MRPSAAAQQRADRKSLVRLRVGLLAGAPIVVAMVLRLTYGGKPAFPSDDAYISLHSARYLASLTDPSYPGTPPLAGATSLLHVVVLRLAMTVLSPEWATELVTWIGAAAFVSGAATMITRRVGSTTNQIALMVIATLVGWTPFALANGQETGWAMAAVMWAMLWTSTDAPAQTQLSVLAGVLPLIRPDCVVVSAAIGARRLLTARRYWLRDLAISAFFIGIGAAVYWRALGTPVPNTLDAKTQYFAAYGFPLVVKLAFAVRVLLKFCLVIGPALIGVWFVVRHRTDRWFAAALVALVLALLEMAPAVLDHNYYRYLHPLVVPIIIAGFASFAALEHNRIRTAVLCIAALWTIVQVPTRFHEYRDAQAIVVDAQGAIAEWLTRNTTPGSTVLVHDAGYLSEHTHAQLVDLVGLKTPSSVQVHARLTGPSLGQRRGDAVYEIACTARPQFASMFGLWDDVFHLTTGLREHGWQLQPTVDYHVPGGESWLRFTLYRLTPPESCRGW